MAALKFLTDENFRTAILRGLFRRSPEMDIIRVQEVGLTSTDDPIILEWAAQQSRIVLTHDLRTMPDFAYERLGRGEKMAGLIAVGINAPIGVTIDDILLIHECMTSEELDGTVMRLPL